VGQPIDQLRRVLAAYRDAGGKGPASLQVHLSYADDDETALRIAHHQWRTNVVGPPLSWDVETVEAFDRIGERIRPEDLHECVLISSDPGRDAAWIAERAALGFDGIYLHHVGQEQHEFIEVFGTRVLPQLDASPP